MHKFKYLVLPVIACVGCSADLPQSADGSAMQGRIDPAVTVSEERLEKLSDIVRSMRDSNAQMMFPHEAEFLAEARNRHPVQNGQDDILLDGWGNPFVYTLYGDNRTYRLHSMGPNGTNEHGTGDDAPSRGGSTEIE